ncbi:MAG: hypothetical protein BWY82_01740 [Verrucomicrobia bacterium ADurb.Bin474]|nr:MAG: hypothetical protein BWY82_01740 [Verrucomicrobia bacterium ADurb.Bin474]
MNHSRSVDPGLSRRPKYALHTHAHLNHRSHWVRNTQYRAALRFRKIPPFPNKQTTPRKILRSGKKFFVRNKTQVSLNRTVRWGNPPDRDGTPFHPTAGNPGRHHFH